MARIVARRLLFLHVSYVASAGYLTEALFVLRGLVAAHLLGPSAFGVWSTIRLVLMFSAYTDAGSNAAMVQSSPQAEGAGSCKRADAHRRVASAVTLTGACLAGGAVALLFGGWLPGEGARHWWWLVAVLVVAQQVVRFYTDALISQRRFGWVAVVGSGSAMLSTLGCIVGAWTLGLDGFLLGMIMAYLLTILVFLLVGPGFPLPAWRFRHAQRLIRIGWPIVLTQALLILLWNVDKLMLWMLSSSEQLGIYAIQSYLAVMVMLLPAAVAGVSLPHLRLRLGQARDASAARPYLFEGTQMLAYLSLPVIGLGFLLLHLPIRWLLADYAEAIAPGRVMILASFPSTVAALSGMVLIALSHHGRLAVIRMVSVGVSAGGAAGVLLAGGGLVGLAFAVSAGFVVHAVLAIGLALRVTGKAQGEAVSLLASVVGPYLILLVVLPGLLHWVPDRPADLVEDLALTATRCGVLLLLLAPLAWHAWRTIETPPLTSQ